MSATFDWDGRSVEIGRIEEFAPTQELRVFGRDLEADRLLAVLCRDAITARRLRALIESNRPRHGWISIPTTESARRLSLHLGRGRYALLTDYVRDVPSMSAPTGNERFEEEETDAPTGPPPEPQSLSAEVVVDLPPQEIEVQLGGEAEPAALEVDTEGEYEEVDLEVETDGLWEPVECEIEVEGGLELPDDDTDDPSDAVASGGGRGSALGGAPEEAPIAT
ncbi:MAG: hypothetical protein IT349_03180 [Candidatus Eisenbacteria bacterium]|nr:hypothetical protein [Candidatus Eisenbacteria bacterium]